MKHRYLSILNLAVILFYLLRPSLPYFEYVINKEYIEKNFCIKKNNPENACHGKCYLHEQLTRQNDLPDADLNNDKKIVPDNKTDDHLRGLITLPLLFEDEIILLYRYYSDDIGSFIADIFVPPKY